MPHCPRLPLKIFAAAIVFAISASLSPETLFGQEAAATVDPPTAASPASETGAQEASIAAEQGTKPVATEPADEPSGGDDVMSDLDSLDPPSEPPPSEPAPELAEEPITPEQEALFAEFEAKRKTWEQTLKEMKKIQILHNNGIDVSAKSMDRFYELRDRARGELNDLFKAAEAFFMERQDEYNSVSLLASVIDYRRSSSYYEDSFNVAKRLIEVGVNMPYLEQMAGRAAFIEGKFDEVLPIYQRYVDSNGPDKLEDIDKTVVGLLNFYPQWWEEELKARAADEAAGDLPRVLLETTSGPIVLELFEDQAPNTVANFIQLVESGFYDESEFYQVIDDLLALGGDPTGDGSGTSGRFIPDEHDRPDRRRIFRGSILMAKRQTAPDSGKMVPNSASSQFVIALMPIVPKELEQTVFGRVVEGMDVVCSFRRVDPTKKKEQQVLLPPDRIISAKVLRKRDHGYSVEYAQ
jgi:peptidylprolyl isomerase